MSSNRSTKSRSLGLSPKQPVNSTPRPTLGDRHKSAPAVPRKHRGSNSRVADNDQDSKRRSRPNSKVRSANVLRDSKKTASQGDAKSQSRSNSKSRNSSSTNSPFLKLVVVGNSSVGKSTFIKYALELRNATSSAIASSWVSLRGMVYRVQMVELHLNEIEIQDGHHVKWPEYVDKVPFNSPDAVVCLYDVAKKESLENIPQFLAALGNLDIPVELVPVELDKSVRDTKPGMFFAEQVAQKLPHVSVADPDSTISQTAQRSMLVALKAVLSNATPDAGITPRPSDLGRSDDTDSNATPVPAAISATPDTAPSISSSEYEASESEIDGEDDDQHISDEVSHLKKLHLSITETSPPLHQAPQTPVSESEPFTIQSFPSSTIGYPEAPQTPESYQNGSMRRPGTSDTTDSRAHQTFFYGGEDSPEERDLDSVSVHKSIKTQSDSISEQGVSFTDLVERLLRLPASKHEIKFVPTFLCLYRAFATPDTLLAEFIRRFNIVDSSADIEFNKVAEMLRYLQILANWTAMYPGDFASQAIRDAAIAFVQEVEKRKSLSSTCREISNNLQTQVEDEDIGWAYNGVDSMGNVESRKGSVANPEYATDDTEGSDTDDELRAMRSSWRTLATTSSVSSQKPPLVDSQSATNQAALDNAREQAKKLRSIPHIGLSKLQWHFFMETPAEDLARELARVDWIRYSAIRPRDFVQEVFRPGDVPTGSNITLMVKHFNQISYFVAGMILLRDKPKHRAQTVEKVMELAWKVRQLNNYNCVSAIVAGMQNISITRLSQTMELVPTETQRQFMRLNILVDASKSYATYRIAWENTTSPRIPLIPALRKDLKVAVLANPTFLGENINWKKFQIMGDAILCVQKSQEMPYAFPDKTQQVQEILRLFLETKIIEHVDDTVDPSKELYDRSKQIEPAQASNETKKRFDWLRR